MTTADPDAPDLFINRELSWLEFNDRVLQQARDPQVPLMERLKFLAIVSSNLDEFFMIRVGGLRQRQAAGRTAPDPSGLTPAEQLARISRRTHRMVAEQTEIMREVLAELAEAGLCLLTPRQLTTKENQYLESYFLAEVLPLLTPLAVEALEPFPVLPGLALNLALELTSGEADEEPGRIAVVPIPGGLPRFMPVPAGEAVHLVPLEQVVRRHIGHLFSGFRLAGTVLFRLTRDADVAVVKDEAGDLLEAAEDAVRTRRRRAPVRLEMSADPDPTLRKWLAHWAEVQEDAIYEIDGLLDASALMDTAAMPGFDHLRDPEWLPVPPRGLPDTEHLWATLQDRDVLLFHPYDSFEPVLSMLDLAADDPSVFAIKQTLYRTSGESPIVAALARAAEKGKQVVALLELRARFDEARNVKWARRLEDAGCHVIYGIAGFKTHAKLLLIVRREAHGIRRYLHLSTGNYNERTARLYSDVGLMTADRDLTADAAAFFNLLTGYSQEVGWNKFSISPTGLRRRIVELIDREIDTATPDQAGLIVVKVNSLQDTALCRALYRASRAGVTVRLNVRGICCLRPGIEGVSENIEVTSIVGRFLEHARVLYFRNGGHEEVYLSSADCMERNLDRRLEVLFPILDPRLQRRLIAILETCFADNVKAWRLLPDGTYQRVKPSGPPVRAQEEFHRAAVEAARSSKQGALRFRPLMNPQEGRGR